jgi:hypothetical protein
MRVIIGHDSREPEATRVALASLRKFGIEGEVLDTQRLRDQGLFWRAEDVRGGQRYDFTSQAPCATEFSNSRFLTPIIGTGLTLFVDADVVFLDDPRHMIDIVNLRNAVNVVKHGYVPKTLMKMDSQAQTVYGRKNWSSVMLFNCDHPANRRLSLRDVNERPGRDLHQFYWLADEEIGDLWRGWNWLVGEQARPQPTGIAHFTLGGPFTPGWIGAEHDEIWLEAAK